VTNQEDLYMRGLGPNSIPIEGMVPYGTVGGLHLPPRYAVAVNDPDCPVLVEVHVAVVDGQPRCAELRCRPRPDGPPVSSESLRRVALARYLRQSAAMYSIRVSLDEKGDVIFMQATGTGDEADLAQAAGRQPRRQMTEDLLRDVARVYSEATSKPVLAVMRRFELSRPTAGRWVMEARKRGFLPPANEPKPKGKR
jgi:hypothetical protein